MITFKRGKINHMLSIRNVLAWCFFTALLLLGTLTAVSAQVGQTTTRAGIASDTGDDKPQPMAGRLSIQVGAFRELSEVKRELLRLREKKCDPFYRYEDSGKKGMWYRVYVGTYPTEKEAREAAGQLVQQGVVGSYLLRKVDAKGEYLFSVAREKKNLQRAELKATEKRAPVQIETSGQNPQDPAARPAASGSEPKLAQGLVPEVAAVRLFLLDAIRFSLMGNRGIDVVAYEPRQAQEEVKGAQSVYDPLLFSDATYLRDPNLESSVTDIVTEDNGITKTGIRKPLETGGSLSAYLETRYGDLNNAEFERVYKNLVAPTLELRQPLLNNLGGKKEKTAIKIANYQANISKEEFREKVIETANSVAKVYWQLYLFRELIAVNQQNLDMAEEVYRREAERLARGITQQLDVARARSNAEARRSTLLRSKEEYRVAMDRLKLLLNWKKLRIDSEYEVIPIEPPRTTPLNVDETEAIETALKYRPEIVKAKQEVMIRQVDEDLAANQRLPKLDAFGRYGVSGYGEDFRDAIDDVSFNEDNVWAVGLNFEWAIGNRSANSQYRKKRLKRLQSNAQLQSIKDDIKLDIKQVLQRIATSRGEIEASRLAKDAAEKVVEGEFTRFDIGQTTNEELLRAQDLLAVTSRSFFRAIADYNIALHDLTRAKGELPDGITIEDATR
jgi:outer membrane protein TolC